MFYKDLRENTLHHTTASTVMGMERTEGASPVQGVILMVAVAVVLASVIAAFALGVAGSVTKAKLVAAMAEQVGDNITVTWHGGQDNGYVSYYYVTLHDTFIQPDTFPGYPPTVGNSTVFDDQATSGLDHVVVTAVFTDGAAQVILDTYV